MTPGSRLHGLRREAWQFGRGLRDALLADYARAYGEPGRPPALIGGELLTDFLGARLAYDALPLDVFAQTSWEDDRALVTVNSRMREIPGVKDAEGVAQRGRLARDHARAAGPAGAPPRAAGGVRGDAPKRPDRLLSRSPSRRTARDRAPARGLRGGGRARRGRLLAPSPAGCRLPGLPGPRQPRPHLPDGGLAPALPGGGGRSASTSRRWSRSWRSRAS